MAFPNTAKAIIELLSPHVSTVRWLSSLERPPLAQVTSLAAPGATESWGRTDRLRIDVYDRDFDSCEALSESLRDLLADRSHGTSHGFLDHVWIEAEPYPLPYPDDSIIHFSFTVRVDVRVARQTL